MSKNIEGNTETGFIFATLREFIHLWKSGKEGTLSLKCKNGKTSVKFQGSLGHPDMPHTQDGRRRKHRAKSAYQAARAPPPTAVSPALPQAGQDRDKSPAKCHQLTIPTNHRPNTPLNTLSAQLSPLIAWKSKQ